MADDLDHEHSRLSEIQPHEGQTGLSGACLLTGPLRLINHVTLMLRFVSPFCSYFKGKKT